MPTPRTEPSDERRDELLRRLALQLDITPSTEVIDLARTSWIDATKQWRQGRGPKPDAAKCVSSADATIRRHTASE